MTGSVRNSLVVGITGGIACGKSEVGRILESMGFAVCDADRVAHDLMEKGTPVYRQVVDFFGSDVLSDDSEISRPALGKEVFGNPAKREALNALVHPAVRARLEEWIAQERRSHRDAAVLVPLLFESGMESLEWDAIVCVSSSEQQVLQRLEKRGLNSEEARVRIDSQMPLEEKERRSNQVIPNTGSLRELEQAVRETAKIIMAGNGL